MRSVAKFCLAVAAILLVVSTAFQALSLCSVLLLESKPAAVFTENTWLVPLWITALALLPVGFFLCIALRNRGGWLVLPLAVAAVGGVLALIVALALKEGLPAQINPLGELQGLTAWRLTYRHLSSVAVGALTVLAAVCHMLGCREDRRRQEEEAYKPVYNLAGTPLFKDIDSTIGLDTFADEKEKPSRPLKRSLRHAMKKQKGDRS